MPKVVGTSMDCGTGPHFEILKSAGFECVEVDRTLNLWRNDLLIQAVHDADAIIAGSEPYTAKVIESLPRLRVIARSGVGFDAIDLAACDKASIAVAITPGVNHHAVAEQTFALLFGVARGFPVTDQRVREGKWKRLIRPRIMGSTLGIVGLGRIGQAVATRAVGLGMKVLAFEPQPNREFVQKWAIDLVSLDDLFARSDYVTLHSPLTPQTRHLISTKSLAQMKPGSVLINTARGGLVDEKALCEALRSGHLRGAGLDVFEVEPLPLDSPLLQIPNVLLSGHVAGIDNESLHDTFTMCAQTIAAMQRGDYPADRIVNLRSVSSWRWPKS